MNSFQTILNPYVSTKIVMCYSLLNDTQHQIDNADHNNKAQGFEIEDDEYDENDLNDVDNKDSQHDQDVESNNH